MRPALYIPSLKYSTLNPKPVAYATRSKKYARTNPRSKSCPLPVDFKSSWLYNSWYIKSKGVNYGTPH